MPTIDADGDSVYKVNGITAKARDLRLRAHENDEGYDIIHVPSGDVIGDTMVRLQDIELEA